MANIGNIPNHVAIFCLIFQGDLGSKGRSFKCWKYAYFGWVYEFERSLQRMEGGD